MRSLKYVLFMFLTCWLFIDTVAAYRINDTSILKENNQYEDSLKFDTHCMLEPIDVNCDYLARGD